MDIVSRNARILDRRTPAEERSAIALEAFKKQFGPFTRYIITALKPISRKYTDKLIEQGDRVENQLKERLKYEYPDLQFRRQGSVSNNTHIRYSSDVDVLVIIDKFVTLEAPQQATFPYKGDPLDDLIELRKDCKRELENAFPAADIDDSGANSIEISGGSLYCKVDVVPSNWYDTNEYKQTKEEYLRGIQILNKKEMKRKLNRPFLFNKLLHDKDVERKGSTRMMIRLLKTIKADEIEEGNNIDFSSFDIASIVYRMPNEYFSFDLTHPLDIFRNLIVWMYKIHEDESIRSSIYVVDDSRLIFDKHEKLSHFEKLLLAAYTLYEGASKENNNRTIITEKHLSDD